MVYTTQVAFSHSGVTGNVVSIMSSSDKKKSFVLFHMADMTLLPADAMIILFLLQVHRQNKKNKS